MVAYDKRVSRKHYTAREAAERVGVSVSTAQRWTSLPRDRWLTNMAKEREEIRAYHDDQGHSWTETAQRFDLHPDTVKKRAYRARKERAAEREEVERKARELKIGRAHV